MTLQKELSATERKRLWGQHMTPSDIADEMVGHLNGSLNELRVLDPACGDGNLLLAFGIRLRALGIEDVAGRLIGMDIDKTMVSEARNRLSREFGLDPALLQIFHGDYLSACNDLLDAPPVNRHRNGTPP